MIDSLGGSGGAEHGLVREITRFPASTEQLVVCLYSKDALASQLHDVGIPTEFLHLDPASAGMNWVAGVSKLSGIVKRFQPDVMHSSLFMGNLVAQIAARRAGIPVLSTFTLSGDPKLLRSFQPNAASLKAGVLRRIAAVAARSDTVRFRALTGDARDTNAKLLGVAAGRSTVIHRGVPIDLLPSAPESRSKLNLPEDAPIVLNIGRQTAQKGHGFLIEAFVKLREVTNAHLVICGREGDASTELIELIASNHLSDRVTVTGYTPDVHHYLAHADVFVFPSLMEGLGTAVLESMSAGVPVVAFDIPPVREISANGEHASLVRVGDIETLARETDQALIGNRANQAKSAQQYAHSTHSVDVIAEQVHTRLLAIVDA